MNDRPPTSPISVLLFLAALVAAAGTVMLASKAPDGSGLTVFGTGAVSVLLLFAIGSIVRGVHDAAWHAEQTARHAQRTADELAKLANKSRHNASPATAGTRV